MKYKSITMIAVATVLAALFMGTASAQSSRARVPAELRHGSSSAPVFRGLANSGISRNILRNSGKRSRSFSGQTGRPLLNAPANGAFSGNASGRSGRSGHAGTPLLDALANWASSGNAHGNTRGRTAMPLLDALANGAFSGNASGRSGRSGHTETPLLDALANGASSGNAHGNTRGRTAMPPLDALANGGTGRGQGSPYYDYPGNNGHHEYSMPEAYRDAAIANSVMNLVGVLCQTAQQPAAPASYYVREKVVLAPAHYETYQVWIPPVYDSRTGQKIGGDYNETRTQLVPEVAGYRDVLVSPGP